MVDTGEIHRRPLLQEIERLKGKTEAVKAEAENLKLELEYERDQLRWRKTSEELPEDDGPYEIWNGNYHAGTAHYRDGEWWFDPDSDFCPKYGAVTHYRPWTGPEDE